VSSSEEAIKETWEKQRRDSKRVVLMEEEEQQEMSFISSEYTSNNRSVGKSVYLTVVLPPTEPLGHHSCRGPPPHAPEPGA
jgi:hypothetical protein